MPKLTYQDRSWRLRKLVLAAVFCALAVVSMFVMRITVVFLTFDSKDAIITLAGLLLGPIYSLAISFITAFIEFITIGDTGPWGFLMDFLSTAFFSVTCALIYKFKKNIKGAIVGLFSAILAMTSFMLLFNLFIVPLYNLAYTTASVAKMIPTLFLPFNLTKGLLNAALVLIIYKPMSIAMKAAKVLPSNQLIHENDPLATKERENKNLRFSLAVSAVGVVIVAICLVIFFLLMDGSFSWVIQLGK